jgi:hypothetical protein
VIIQSAVVLEAVKAQPGNGGACLENGATAGLDSPLRAPACNFHGRGGRKPAARSNKRNDPRKKKALAFVVAIRERKNGSAGAEQKNGLAEENVNRFNL